MQSAPSSLYWVWEIYANTQGRSIIGKISTLRERMEICPGGPNVALLGPRGFGLVEAVDMPGA